MPRTPRSTSGRLSRTWGELSAVTLQTLGSGVTIDKQYINMGSGVSIHNTSLIHTSQGYPVYQPSTNNVNIIAGTTDAGGVSRYMSATMLGLNTVTEFLCQVSSASAAGAVENSGASMIIGHIQFDNYANTGVTVYLYNANSGATHQTGVSIHYLAFGT